MSPLALRRYRAERLLRRDFHALRPSVLAGARRRLALLQVRLDDDDLEACYAQAWHGLYATVLAGEAVAAPAGWLVTVTVRRAIDEHRQRARRGLPAASLPVAAGLGVAATAPEPEVRLDELSRLREVFEALRGRLSTRECEAASLCYLQGLTRAEAARRMGVSPRRMDKLMDGPGAGTPGVAAKVDELLTCIRGGHWCEEQASLMRGLAFGLLDPHGERYRLALVHQRECPACRAYVASLRGLAAVLPPLSVPPSALGAGAGAAAGANGAAAAGGAGAAGGGWLMLGGSMTAKVAASCLIAFGLGAGCLSLGHLVSHRAGAVAVARAHRPRQAGGGLHRTVGGPLAIVTSRPPAVAVGSVNVAPVAPTLARPDRRTPPPAPPAERAAREFGPESVSAPTAPPPPPAPAGEPAAHAAITPSSAASAVAPAREPSGGSVGSAQRAEREFGVP